MFYTSKTVGVLGFLWISEPSTAGFSASFCASGAIYLGVPARRSDGNWRFFRVGMIGILYLILKNNIIMIREKHPESPWYMSFWESTIQWLFLLFSIFRFCLFGPFLPSPSNDPVFWGLDDSGDPPSCRLLLALIRERPKSMSFGSLSPHWSMLSYCFMVYDSNSTKYPYIWNPEQRKHVWTNKSPFRIFRNAFVSDTLLVDVGFYGF